MVFAKEGDASGHEVDVGWRVPEAFEVGAEGAVVKYRFAFGEDSFGTFSKGDFVALEGLVH